MIMKKLLTMILILSSTNSFSFSRDFEIQNSKNQKKKVSLDLLVGSVCYEATQEKLIIYSYFGGNLTKEFFNSCAVVEYEVQCLGKIVPSGTMNPKFEDTFCIKPVKHKVISEKIIYKSFTDKYECKRKFDNLNNEARGGGDSIRCSLAKYGELIDEFVEFDNKP